MQKILCICIGNRSRSPMMQALLQLQLGNTFDVESAGIRREAAGLPANERSIECMRKRGIDLLLHQSRWAGDLDLSRYSHIVCVGEDEARQVRELLRGSSRPSIIIANGDRGGIPDPFEKGLPGYWECLALLDEVIPRIAKLVRESMPEKTASNPPSDHLRIRGTLF